MHEYAKYIVDSTTRINNLQSLCQIYVVAAISVSFSLCRPESFLFALYLFLSLPFYDYVFLVRTLVIRCAVNAMI